MLLAEALERHACERPHALAALDPYRTVDWTGLRDQVASLAGGFARAGVHQGDRVAIHLPNGLDFLVTALACHWIGATFAPFAVTNPPARTHDIADDCQPALVVVGDDADVAALGLSDFLSAGIGGLQGGPPRPRSDIGDVPPYIIYTSGTTARPKGVVIGERALGAALQSTSEAVGLGPQSRTMCVSPFHFDGSFANLFGTVHAGGLVTIPPRESLLFPRFFNRWVLEKQIDTTGFTPSYLRLLLTGGGLDALAESPLHTVALGGEALSAKDLLKMSAILPRLRLFNRYGPTETAIAVAHHQVRVD
ncbi:MAG: AMP-binding protein, partial [Acidimicrobiales bacterium]